MPESQDAATAPARRGRKADSILAAARDLFLDHGFETITMDMVARQAPVSKATLYAHFASKEELFTAAMVDEADRVIGEVWQVEPAGNDVAASLRHIAEKFAEIFLSERAMFLRRAIIGVVPKFPAIGAAIFESGPKAMAERLARFLAEADRAGRLNVPDPALAAIQFLSLVRGDLDIRCMLLPTTPPGRGEIEAQIQNGIALFLRAYAPAEA